MTPTRLQSDDPGLSNSPEQADGSQSKSDKIAIIFDTIEHYPKEKNGQQTTNSC